MEDNTTQGTASSQPPLRDDPETATTTGIGGEQEAVSEKEAAHREIMSLVQEATKRYLELPLHPLPKCSPFDEVEHRIHLAWRFLCARGKLIRIHHTMRTWANGDPARALIHGDCSLNLGYEVERRVLAHAQEGWSDYLRRLIGPILKLQDVEYFFVLEAAKVECPHERARRVAKDLPCGECLHLHGELLCQRTILPRVMTRMVAKAGAWDRKAKARYCFKRKGWVVGHQLLIREEHDAGWLRYMTKENTDYCNSEKIRRMAEEDYEAYRKHENARRRRKAKLLVTRGAAASSGGSKEAA